MNLTEQFLTPATSAPVMIMDVLPSHPLPLIKPNQDSKSAFPSLTLSNLNSHNSVSQEVNTIIFILKKRNQV